MKTLLATTASLFLSAGVASAEAPAPGDVKYGEYGAVAESLTGTPGDAANGRKVAGNKSLGNCVACHKIPEMADDVPWHGEVGPSLEGAGERWDEPALRGLIADAKKTLPGTMMPSFYKSSGYTRPGDDFTGKAGTEPLPPLLTAQQVEDVVAYLMTLK